MVKVLLAEIIVECNLFQKLMFICVDVSFVACVC